MPTRTISSHRQQVVQVDWTLASVLEGTDMMLSGYFTTERNIQGRTLAEITEILGLPSRRMETGAAVYAMLRQPTLDEFEWHGSTLCPAGQGLNREAEARTRAIPGAWHGQQLVKVVPQIAHATGDAYPPVVWTSTKAGVFPAEQWWLKWPVPFLKVCDLRPGQVYWGRGGRGHA